VLAHERRRQPESFRHLPPAEKPNARHQRRAANVKDKIHADLRVRCMPLSGAASVYKWHPSLLFFLALEID
jgi:hypothetical protein